METMSRGKRQNTPERNGHHIAYHIICAAHIRCDSVAAAAAAAFPELLYTSAQRHISVENMAHAFQESHRKQHSAKESQMPMRGCVWGRG